MPAIGAALDNGRTEEPYWKRVFSGFEKSQAWMRETKPDVAIVVYNDHASAFSVDLIQTFALGDKVDEVYRFYTVPASNTAVGHIILENRKSAAGKSNAGKGKKPAARLKRAAARTKMAVRRGAR